ncbi:hypothetical protein C5D35_00845 [Rathayibacter toxicus]|nr:hypothetical protein C5D35_00845 [Rathayibacter toxicus]
MAPKLFRKATPQAFRQLAANNLKLTFDSLNAGHSSPIAVFEIVKNKIDHLFGTGQHEFGGPKVRMRRAK